MKTIEEKDDAVLAELQALSESREPKMFCSTKFRDDYYVISWGEDQERIAIGYFGRTTPRAFDPINTERVYNLLGLKARDAVQAALAEIHAKATIVLDRLPLHDYTTDKNEDCYLPKAFVDSLGDLELLIESQKKRGAGE